MSARKVFIIDGHPADRSLTRTLAETYSEAARDAGHEVRITHLHDLRFDADFEHGSYSEIKPLEPPLERVLKDLEWSDHVVIAAPLWWGGLPAKLKGVFDRVLLPGRAFDTRKTNVIGMPLPMLTGRTGRVLLMTDTPGWFLRFAYGNAIVRQLRRQVLGFVGIRPARVSVFSGASHPREGTVERWQKNVRRIGRAAA